MKLKKIFPYNIKKALPVLGLAGASLFMAGCNKDDEPITLTREVEITFDQDEAALLMHIDGNGNTRVSDLVKYYDSDPNVQAIYVVPKKGWGNFVYGAIQNLRTRCLEPLFLYSDKIHARGDFDFRRGEASKVPEDSLWYVSKGWTINKYRTASESKAKHR